MAQRKSLITQNRRNIVSTLSNSALFGLNLSLIFRWGKFPFHSHFCTTDNPGQFQTLLEAEAIQNSSKGAVFAKWVDPEFSWSSATEQKRNQPKSEGLEFAPNFVFPDCHYITQLEGKTKQDIYVLSQTAFKVTAEFVHLVMIPIQVGLKLDRLPLWVTFPEAAQNGNYQIAQPC